MSAERIAQLKAELAQAKQSREYFSQIASETQDDSYAAQSEGERMGKVALASTYRQTAGRFSARILDIAREIAELETAEAYAAVDETIGALS